MDTLNKNTNKKTSVPVVRLERCDVSDSDTASSMVSMTSMRSAESVSSKRLRKRARTNAEHSGSDTALSDKEDPAPKVAAGPAMAGQYVGLAKARRELKAAQKVAAAEDRRAEDERQVAALTEKVIAGRITRLSESSAASTAASIDVAVADMTASDLNTGMMDAVAAIKRVGKVSKGLSGCSQKALKEATASIVAYAEALLQRTSTEETAKLQAENTRLAAKVAELRKEHNELRAEMASFRLAHLRTEIGLPQQPQESELASLLRQELTSLNARFGVLEGRLLRPPLAADSRGAPTPTNSAKAAATTATYAAKAAAVQSGAKTGRAATSSSSLTTPMASTSKKGKGKGKKTVVPVAPSTSTQGPSQGHSEAPKPSGGEWEEVGAKKKAKKAKNKAKKTEKKAAKAAKKDATRLRAPRSTAVVLTLQPGAEERGLSYAGILAKAKAEISLPDLGIAGIRCKPTATGARLLEISGASSGPKADALAEKLRASLSAEDVKVSRPTKCADLRISGLDDSVTPEEVAGAVARAGECQQDQVKVGTIRPGFSGLGTVLVGCPVAAAQKIMKGNRLLVGWVSAQVKLLTPKPLRCYRCIEEGHVGVRCTSGVDRSQLCFRCGQPGHKAASCSAAPHCVVCAAAGKPAEHRAGSKACAGTKRKKRPAKAGLGATDSSQPTHPPAAGNKEPQRAVEETIAMETQ